MCTSAPSRGTWPIGSDRTSRAKSGLRRPSQRPPEARRLASRLWAAGAATSGGTGMSSTYEEVYASWLADPEGFWARAAEAIDWDRRWDRVLDSSRPPFYRWFSGGVLNTCHNCLD